MHSQRLPSQAYPQTNRPSQLLSQGVKLDPASKSCSGGAYHFVGNVGGWRKLGQILLFYRALTQQCDCSPS